MIRYTSTNIKILLTNCDVAEKYCFADIQMMSPVRTKINHNSPFMKIEIS